MLLHTRMDVYVRSNLCYKSVWHSCVSIMSKASTISRVSQETQHVLSVMQDQDLVNDIETTPVEIGNEKKSYSGDAEAKKGYAYV